MALADNNASVVLVHHMDDASGNAIATVGGNLTDNNSVGTGTGKISSARDFELGSAQYLSAGDATWNSFGDIDCSIAFWVNFESVSATRSLVFKENGTMGDYYIFLHSGNTIRAGANYDGAADIIATNFGTISAATWYSVVWVHDSVNNQIRLYVNAVKNSISYTGGIGDVADVFRVGNDFYNNYHDGLIDELVIWKGYALTDADATEFNSVTPYPFASAGGPIDGGRQQTLRKLRTLHSNLLNAGGKVLGLAR